MTITMPEWIGISLLILAMFFLGYILGRIDGKK